MRLKTMLLATAMGSMPVQLFAQGVAQPQDSAVAVQEQTSPVSPTGQVVTTAQTSSVEEPESDIVVVGSRIVGAPVTEALPVVVLDETKLDAIGAVSGDELIRAIPQMGDVTFNPGNNAQTSNAARGDVGSVNLRSLGVGNTLVLLNGRRIVTHPASQGLSDTGTVPVLSYNSNAIPTMGLSRLEVLLDGAAALYGSDAVAGVVNTVTKDNYNGLRLEGQFGGAEGTHLREYQVGVIGGKSFERGNITASVEYTRREALLASDQDYTESADLRPLFADDPDFGGLVAPDARATRGTYPGLQVPVTGGRPRRGATNLTSAAGAFTVRPVSFGGCTYALSSDLCLVNTALATTGAFRDLRYDTAIGTTVLPKVDRVNAFANGHYDLTDGLTVFGELGYYRSNTVRVQPPVINLNRITIPASNFYNPFGPTTINGAPNPNRIPGLTNVPASGLPVLLTNYRFVDAGPQKVEVSGEQRRALIGIKARRSDSSGTVPSSILTQKRWTVRLLSAVRRCSKA